MEMFWSFVGGMIIGACFGMMLLALIIAGTVGDE